jgi:hypothetical protein
MAFHRRKAMIVQPRTFGLHDRTTATVDRTSETGILRIDDAVQTQNPDLGPVSKHPVSIGFGSLPITTRRVSKR